jgi:hypothetical protein
LLGSSGICSEAYHAVAGNVKLAQLGQTQRHHAALFSRRTVLHRAAPCWIGHIYNGKLSAAF